MRSGRMIMAGVLALSSAGVWMGAAAPVVHALPPAPVFTTDVNGTFAGSTPANLTVVGSLLFFTADDGVHGAELYVTDGIAAPTLLDLNPGAGGSNPLNLTAIGSTLWFAADNGTEGYELWTSDGTQIGTAMIADIYAGFQDSLPGDFVAFDGQVYFSAADAASGRELWRSDGTTASLAADVRAGSTSSNPSELVAITYSAAPAQPSRLWFGASAGLNSLRDLVAFDDLGNVTVELTDKAPIELVAVGEQLSFVGTSAAVTVPASTDLWQTTRSGAVFTTTSLAGSPFNLTAFNGALYFTNNDPTVGQEFATVAGGVITTVKDIVPGIGSSAPFSFTPAGSTLYFVASTPAEGAELWRSDGTEVGTTLVADIEPGSTGSLPGGLRAGPAGRILFTARTTVAGREPWAYAGSGSPVIIEDVVAGAGDSGVEGFRFVAGAGVFLGGIDLTVGNELLRWPAPFTPDTIAPFADLRPGTEASFPSTPVAVGTKVVFFAQDDTVGFEPRVYDTVGNTTALLADLNPGVSGSGGYGAVSLGSTALFFADDGTGSGSELWRTDGTSAGTVFVKDINAGAVDANADASFAWNGVAYFMAETGAAGLELWRSDGTAAGTFQVKDIVPGIDGSSPSGFTPMGANLYFVADLPTGSELWRTDGTTAGTVAVATGSSRPLGVTNLVATSNRVLFTAEDATGLETVLWRSDGSAAGTVVVQDPALTHAVFPQTLTVSGTKVFFHAESSADGDLGIWVTDGTAAGTTDLLPAVQLLPQDDMAATPTGVVFVNDDPASGIELWKSDGTAGTTALLEDFVAGPDAGTPTSLTTMNGFVYLTASTAANGRELWRTDGTALGTERVTDLVGGAGNSLQLFARLDVASDRLWFEGTDVAHGGEMWFVADVPALPAAPSKPAATGSALSAVVSWAAVANVAYAPVTGYTVTASPGGATCTTSALTCTVNGLTAGQPYTFTVRATNRIGQGPASPASDPAVPTAPVVPAAPAAPSATAGQQSATVSWSAVANPVGAPVTGYTATASPGGATCTTTGATTCVVPNLTAGTPYTFTVTATNAVGTSPSSPTSNTVVPLAPAVVTVLPARVLETRTGEELVTVDGRFQGIGRQAGGTTLELVVAGRANVPADAGAVMVNVTAVSPATAGFLTVFPCGEDRPNASSVNYQAQQVVPNAVLAKIGAGGAICVYTTATSDLLVDVNGYVPAGGSPATVLPARLLDTRSGPGIATTDGLFLGIGRQADGATVELAVAGRGNVPANAAAVMLNVTAVAPENAGFLTVYPCGEDRPNASSVNYQAGQVVPNAVLAQVGANGTVCIFTVAASHLIVDVNGYVPAGSAPTPVVPARLLETRSGAGLTTADGAFQGIGRQPAGSVVELLVTGRGNVPANASAVMLNVTAVGPAGPGFLTVFPCGSPQPGASSVNYQAGQVVPNAVLAKIGTGGRVCIFTLADADLLVDVTGWT